MSVKDRNLKESIMKHYWAQRCFVEPEVDLYYSRGSAGSTKLVTDLDVLVLRPHPDLRFERILGDCRTLKYQSPVTRALWLKGLMTFYRAHAGIAVLSLPQIEADHKLAAHALSVILLTDAEFREYDKAIVYPAGSADTPITLDTVLRFRAVAVRFPQLKALVDYVHRGAFLDVTAGDVLRHTIGQLQSAAHELNPADRDHVALVLNTAAVFSMGLAECCGAIFHQYLKPEQKTQLSDALRVLIWGGKEQYTFYETIRAKLIERQQPQTQSPLELPQWNTFLQLVRNILEMPMAALSLPWLFRQYSLGFLANHITGADLLALKFAMLVLEYLCKAAGLPRDFVSATVPALVSIQGSLVSKTDAPNEADVRGNAPSALSGTNSTTHEGSALPLSPSPSLWPESSQRAR